MDKKAYSMSFALLIVITLIILILPTYWGITIIIDRYTNLISTYDLENHLIIHKISYSKNSIFYTDKIIDRTYTNTVDIERFNENVLNQLLGTLPQDVGVRLVLEFNDNKMEIHINKQVYLLALSRSDIYERIDVNRIVRLKGLEGIGKLSISVVFKENV
ncbi:MAG: hypothetical protein AABY14_01870 [Nanoarchaeota archaeon]